MKVVGSYSSRTDAEVARGFLENSGIRTMVSSNDEGGLHPALGAQFRATLSVADDDFDKAIEILQQVEQASPIEDE